MGQEESPASARSVWPWDPRGNEAFATFGFADPFDVAQGWLTF